MTRHKKRLTRHIVVVVDLTTAAVAAVSVYRDEKIVRVWRETSERKEKQKENEANDEIHLLAQIILTLCHSFAAVFANINGNKETDNTNIKLVRRFTKNLFLAKASL